MQTLYMVQLGARPKGRLIEQHDMFFGVAEKISDLIPAINQHWLEVKDKWHIDSYRAVTKVGNYHICWQDDNEVNDNLIKDLNKDEDNSDTEKLKLFFLNLGGYQQGSFEEHHHKMLVVAATQAEAIKQAKQTVFYQDFSVSDEDTPFDASSHIDDKMQVDVDDIYDVNGLITSGKLVITPIQQDSEATKILAEDKEYVGYLSIKKLKKLQAV